MPKKNLFPPYTSGTPFLLGLRETLLKEAVRGAIVGVFILITMYFAIRTLGDRVSALETREDLYSRKDVTEVQLNQLSRTIYEVKEDTREIRKYLLKESGN